MVLVLALAVVIGFGVAKVFEHEGNTRLIAQSGAQLDAMLGNHRGSTSTPRWYDNPSSIGLVAGGAVVVVGIVVVAGMKPKAP